MRRLKTLASWIAGIATFVALCVLVTAAYEALSIPTEFGGEPITVQWGRGAESETAGGTHGYVFAFVLAAGIIAFRVGAAIKTGRLDAGLSKGGLRTVRFMLGGLVAFGLIDTAFRTSAKHLGATGPLATLAELAIAGGVLVFCLRLWQPGGGQSVAEMRDGDVERRG